MLSSLSTPWGAHALSINLSMVLEGYARVCCPARYERVSLLKMVVCRVTGNKLGIDARGQQGECE